MGSSDRLFRGWWMVSAGFAALFVGYGIQFSFGTFVDDIVVDTGWSRSRLQLIFAFYVGGYSMLSWLSGWATDRFGPRPVVASGSVALVAGYLLWANANSLWMVFLGLGLIAPVGMSGTWVPCNATVVRWFVTQRGLATAITTVGGSAANIIVPPIAAVLVEQYGWRTAITSMALTGGVLMLLASTVLVRDPESVGLLPDGEKSAPGQAPAVEEPTFTAVEASRTATYWKLLAIYGLTFTVVFVPFVHLVPFAQGFGASLRTASTVLSSIGVGGLLGRLIVGPISDRIDRRKAVVLTLMLETAAFVGIALSSNLWLLYPSALAFGFAYGGGVTVFPALVGDYFGRANVGAIVGRVFASAGALSAVGPYGAQLMYDQFGSYRLAFLLSAAANGMAMVLATRLPQPHH